MKVSLQAQHCRSVLPSASRRLRTTNHDSTHWYYISHVVFIAIAIVTNTITAPVVVVVSAFSSSSSLSTPNIQQQQYPRIPFRRPLSNNDSRNYQSPNHDGHQSRKQNHFPTTTKSFRAQQQQQLSSTIVLYSFFENKNDPDIDTENIENDYIEFDNDPRDQWYVSSMTTTMVCTQAAFIPIGIVLASMIGIDLNFSQLRNGNHDSMLWLFGVLSTIPLAIFAIVLDAVEDQVPALQDVSEATLRSVYNLLGGSYKPLLALITAVVLGTVAGVGEEILFRGVLQEMIYQQQWTTNYNAVVSIVISSVVFGLFHAVTPMYVALATIASLYFGTLYTLSNGDLTIPILCHSIYDIGALLYAHYTISQLPFPKLQQLIANGGSETSSTGRANVD